MLRLSTILIATCMLLIAGSVGVVVYLSYGFTRIDAAVVALAAFTVLVLLNSASTRARDRADIGDHIADLSRGTTDLGRKVAEIERRIGVAEDALETGGDKPRAARAAKIELRGAQIRQLADSVADHERALLERGATEAPAGRAGRG
jgi:cyclic-di-GMP phosphodiesterase, flagellum assembly factor TipF